MLERLINIFPLVKSIFGGSLTCQLPTVTNMGMHQSCTCQLDTTDLLSNNRKCNRCNVEISITPKKAVTGTSLFTGNVCLWWKNSKNQITEWDLILHYFQYCLLIMFRYFQLLLCLRYRSLNHDIVVISSSSIFFDWRWITSLYWPTL